MTILKKDNGTAAPTDAGAQYQMAVDKVLPDTLNNTTGAGSNPVAGIDVVGGSVPTFADLDNDGDLDLVVGAVDGHLYYYENTGSRSQPVFTERTDAANPLAGIDVGHYSTPAFADLDGDGDLDLVVGEGAGSLHYYENTGSHSQPDFTERTGAADPVDGINVDDVSIPTFVDLDGDGDLDLVVGEWDGILNYYENTGTRSQPDFTERTGAANPLAGIDVGDYRTPTFTDLDGDGDLDLIVGEWNGTLDYYENTGTRSQPDFTERTGAANPFAGIDKDYAIFPAFADLDDDGDLDLVVGKDVGYLYYYENTGTRTEGDFNPYSLKEDNGDAVAGVNTQYTMSVGDVFQGTLNNTTGDEENPIFGVRVEDHNMPAFADLDGDGDLDLVVSEYHLTRDERDGTLHYYENTGSHSQPTFTERTGADNPLEGLDMDYRSAPTFADLDGDGDPDLVVGNLYGNLYYYENIGSRSQPAFTETSGANNPLDGIVVEWGAAPAFADLDGDGDLDLVVGEHDGILRYYENIGTPGQPTFTEHSGADNPLDGVDMGKNAVLMPTFADLDGDGDLDLVVGENEGILHYYENTGTGSQPVFTERTGAANPLAGIDVGGNSTPTFADLDDDGDLDLVVGEWDGVLNYYENTGNRTSADFNPYSPNEDWIRVKLTAGTIYRISLEGVGTTAEDTQFHLSLLDSSGDNILSTVSSYGSDAVIDIQPVSATGTYYLKVESGDDDADVWDYQVSVVENTIPEGTYDEIADYLTNGYWEGDGRSRRAFNVEPGGTLTADITTLTPAGQQFARWALEAWTAVTGIGFEFVDGDAHITFDDEDGEDVGGYAWSTTTEDGEILSSFVNVWKDSLPVHATIDSYALYTYLHEIGHALGLGHPGPYGGEGVTYSDHAKFLNDSKQATVMSYFSPRDNTYIEASNATPVTPMLADIIAIQNLYGAPTDINLGDTVYGYHSNVDGYLGQLFSLQAGEGNPFVDIDVGDWSAPALADLDSDGDLDLVVGEDDDILHYYENVGTRSQPDFIERTGVDNPLAGIDVAGIDVPNYSNPTFADLDDDGDLDLVVGEYEDTLHYYENTGTHSQPDFIERTGAANPLDGIDMGWWSSVPTFADLDNDGDLDLVAGEWAGTLHYYENTGSRSQPGFTERTGVDNPLDGIEVDYNSAPTFADLDNDGDLDLVVGEWYGALHYYENTGTRSQPGFAARTDAANPLAGIDVGRPKSIPTFADLDDDGDLDLVVGEWDGVLYYYENTGSRTEASFTPHSLSEPVVLTLYDNGGSDTLDLRTDTADQRVDLRPEGISDVYGLDL